MEEEISSVSKFEIDDEQLLSDAEREYTGEPPKDAGPATGAKQPVDPFHIPAPAVPTQYGPQGIRFDFNDGARILLPKGQWHVQLIDEESGNILFACDADDGWIVSTKKYFVLFRIKIWNRSKPSEAVLDHLLDMKNKPVLIKFPVGSLGDLVGWFPYAEKFLRKHECVLECSMGQLIVDLFKEQYPDILFSVPPETKLKEPYATYRVGLFFGGNKDNQPYDFRYVGLHRTAGYILGVDPAEVPPRLAPNPPREIKEPYVCIAVKSTTLAKMWNNGYGWSQVIDYLKSLGYRVLCIDKERTIGMGHVWNHIPHGAEDFTGNRSLSDRAAMIHHADFFVGLPSGLSWLAWAAGAKIVMIAGFSLPNCEFYTPYRVQNTHGCKGCWDDTSVNFDHKDYFWCPHHKGTDRQYECSRLITGRQVIRAIERLMVDYGIKPPKDRQK